VGRYFDAAEPESLAERLEWVRRHPGQARARGRAAARRAAILFSWERVADRYAALFERLAGRPELGYAREA
jgi:glycosyltransferase involved in cell wall biosynthesis